MKIDYIKIRFIIAKNKANQAGKCPIRCRITYKQERAVFSPGLSIHPDNWYSKLQKAQPPDEENEFLNTQLSLIKNKINQAFLLLQMEGKDFTVQDIYHRYKGEPTQKEKSVLEVFDMHNERLHKLVGIEYSKFTYAKFIETRKHLFEFMQIVYSKKDVMLKDLTLKFLDDLDYYFKTERGQSQSTINKHIQRLRKIVTMAIGEGFLDKDPFLMHKRKKAKTTLIYLTTDELAKLEQYEFEQDRLEQIRDIFVFCCYTGLAYTEMANLKAEHIVDGFDGMKWIKMMRQKTKSMIAVPLLPKALEILDKYRTESSVLPKISNQKFNSYMREITAIVGINKRVTHHVARKTFATTVLLYNDVPMEIVSELLGHSKLAMTQKHYGKIVQKKVSEKMMELRKKLK